jgi:hypothetical protein
MADSFRETGTSRSNADRRGSPWANLTLAVISVSLSLVFIEFAYRYTAGIPIFDFTNWRSEKVVFNRIGYRAVVDPILGWTLKPWNNFYNYTTIDHGIRTNFGEKTVRTGAILAVGDSYTEGWDVDDDDSWPAALERLTGTPVVNAGVFGYGTDQIILRAEQLLPIVQPKILIVGFLEFDIFRSAHSSFGSPKPYFTFESGQLQFHPPQPIEPSSQHEVLAKIDYEFRDILGYSAVADFLLARLTPNYWYTETRRSYRRVNIDAVAITCALLKRLKKRVDTNGIRMLLFMQHNEYRIFAGTRPSENARRVVACAETAGIQVVDQFTELHALAITEPSRVRDYYFPDKYGLGHMTVMGNQQAAELLAEALGKKH